MKQRIIEEQACTKKIDLLKQLGLSLSQASVYLALAESEQSSAQAISNATKIHRANVYRIIISLECLGLVERRLTAGKNFFAAMPLKDGFQLLLKRKDIEYFETRAKAKRVINLLKVQRKNVLAENNERFDLIPKGEANLRAFIKGMEHASSSIDDVIPWKGFEHALLYSWDKYRKTLKRGVKIRYITNFPEEQKTSTRVSNIFKKVKELKEIGFDVRSIANPPSCVFAVFDKKEACICTFPIPNPLETPALWSNNSTLVSLAQAYFDSLWLNSRSVLA